MKTQVCLAALVLLIVQLTNGQTPSICDTYHNLFLDGTNSYDGVCLEVGCPSGSNALFNNTKYIKGCASATAVCCNKTASPTTTTTVSPVTLQCGYDAIRVSPRIANGLAAYACDWPWMVSVGNKRPDGTNKHVCSGVLISPNKTLTTKRCIDSVQQNASSFFVMVGENNLGRVDVFQKEVAFAVSSDVKQNIASDLAVITLSENFEPSICVLPACLAQNDTKYEENMDCFIAAWDSDVPASTTLKTARATIVNGSVCETMGDLFNFQVDSKSFCARPKQRGMDADNQGNRGGMLMCVDKNGVYRLRGIISKTSKDLAAATSFGSTFPFSVYSDVAAAHDWIKNPIP